MRNTLAAHAMVAVAPGDEIAFDLLLDAALDVRDPRRRAGDVVQSDRFGFVDVAAPHAARAP